MKRCTYLSTFPQFRFVLFTCFWNKEAAISFLSCSFHFIFHFHCHIIMYIEIYWFLFRLIWCEADPNSVDVIQSYEEWALPIGRGCHFRLYCVCVCVVPDSEWYGNSSGKCLSFLRSDLFILSRSIATSSFKTFDCSCCVIRRKSAPFFRCACVCCFFYWQKKSRRIGPYRLRCTIYYYFFRPYGYVI